MSASYESAKRVALGLVAENKPQEPVGDDLWNISLGSSFGVAAEMPFQYFEKGFDPPEELTAHKAGLMLYEDEFAADQKAAETRYAALKQVLQNADFAGLTKLLSQTPLVQWMTLIFLDGETLRNELVPLLDSASPDCKKVLSDAISQALAHLVDFKDLLEALQKHC